MDALRLSVRALVAFSIFQEDILPFSSALMEEGRQAHLNRQDQSEGRREVPFSWEGTVQGLPIRVMGRADLCDLTCSPPLIEEIKLCGGDPPMEPLPEHLAQALCYAYMLCAAEGYREVAVRVSYADVQGNLRADTVQTYGYDELEQRFHALLFPYAAWQKKLLRHRAKRDASLLNLPFPYPAYRPGQREMAAQVYTAIVRHKRLFAVMPTGTGKSAAVLYPALKALGLHHCNQLFCLTARGTAARAMEGEIARMKGQGLKLWSLSMTAKEKLCPMEEVRCHPDHCPRAKGHYLRQPMGVADARARGPWDTAFVQRMADRHMLCPFEFSLALSVLSDVVIGDYNYFFDPRTHIRRVFDRPQQVAVLCDEVHNLPDRARAMLSGDLDAAGLVRLRRDAGRALGRRGALWRGADALLKAMRAEEPALSQLLTATDTLFALLAGAPAFSVPGELIRQLLGFLDALRRAAEAPEDYQLLWEGEGDSRYLQLLCLHFTPFLQKATAGLHGFVGYSATLAPLVEMRNLLGGDPEDACFSLPSPFPPGHMLCLQLPVNTRYQAREGSLPQVADAIRALSQGRPGKYIAFFPSYRYMEAAAELLQDLPLHVQQRRMGERQRQEYLARFTQDEQPLLALCVLGGVFAEGIDLPGLSLIGVCVVGVGLPQVGPEREAIRRRAQQAGQSGFDVAYKWPGLHKVQQAAGRLIRSESDRGVLLLCDERYRQAGYRSLLPAHWQVRPVAGAGEIMPLVQEFWGAYRSKT